LVEPTINIRTFNLCTFLPFFLHKAQRETVTHDDYETVKTGATTHKLFDNINAYYFYQPQHLTIFYQQP
jgi:hypothetical protein